MAEALIDHLWQSTLCVLAAGFLALAFSKDGARVRFFIWFAATVKFLIPCALLVWLGGHLGAMVPGMLPMNPRFAAVVEQISSPAALFAINFAAPSLAPISGPAHFTAWSMVFLAWIAGAVCLFCWRAHQWLRLRAIARVSTPLDIDAPIPVRATPTDLEPGLFGIVSPQVLLPAGLASHLDSAQLRAVLDHELCHWRRRDNLTSAIHMLVETLFWFHPLVWWMGTRLVLERERACDEAVIQAGNDRHAYAEGILKVCRRYIESSLWSAGVSGGPLQKRIEEIMRNPVLPGLSLTKKSLLAMAGALAIAAPVAAGLWGTPGSARADQANSAPLLRYIDPVWKFQLDLPTNWRLLPSGAAPSLLPRQVMTFGTSDSADRLLIVSPHAYDPGKETFSTILASAQQDMSKTGFVHFVPGAPMTIGTARAIRLDFERAPKDGEGIWYCRNYYVLGPHGAFVLAFGARNITSAQRDAVFAVYDHMAKSFALENM